MWMNSYMQHAAIICWAPSQWRIKRSQRIKKEKERSTYVTNQNSCCVVTNQNPFCCVVVTTELSTIVCKFFQDIIALWLLWFRRWSTHHSKAERLFYRTDGTLFWFLSSNQQYKQKYYLAESIFLFMFW